MKYLTKSAFDKAVVYIKQNARPLEQAGYVMEFESGDRDNVLNALAAFQNDDGGFGHGLESDLRLKESSVIATTVAFQHFRGLHAPTDHPMVTKACAYLVKTYDANHINWQIIPANIDDAPHAPWWTFKDDMDERLANPRAEIAGYLHDYAAHFPADMRETVTNAVIDFLLAQPDEMEMHDLQCYMRLWQTTNLPETSRARIFDKLKRTAQNTVNVDPESWKAYGLPPLSIVSSPDSPFAELFEDAVEKNLDFIIETQGENGAWMPAWSWEGDAWKQAQQEISGAITLGNLRTLKAFNRLEQ